MSNIIKHLSRFASIVLAVLICSLGASGQVLRGNVVNGTTRKPAAGDDVILLKLDKGMNEEKRTKTNARGEFSFELPDNQFMRVVRVVHNKVPFNQQLVPGSATVTVTVYESEPTVQGIHQTIHSMIFQAQGNTLQGFSVINIQNDSQPPRAQPAFSFYLPEGATVVEGNQAMGEGRMPLRVTPIPLGDNKYSVQYPILPGQTHFEIVYTVPYSGTLRIQPKLIGAVDKFLVITPKSMQFASESPSQFQPSDPNVFPDLRGMDIHQAASTADEKQLAFSIAGEGMIPQDTQQAAGGRPAQGRPGEEDRPGGGMGIPNERPNPLSQGQWAFLGVLSLFMAGGAAFVFMSGRHPTVVAAGPSPNSRSAPLLDALKEEMFQLESDRIQGKLSQQEYQGAKAVLDKTLQRAMEKKQ